VYPIKRKADVFQFFKFYKAHVELESGKKIKCLRTDNVEEYTSKEFDEFCKEKLHQKAIYYSIHFLTKWSGRADEQDSVGKNKSYDGSCRPRQEVLGKSSQHPLLCGKSSSINYNRVEDTDGDVDW